MLRANKLILLSLVLIGVLSSALILEAFIKITKIYTPTIDTTVFSSTLGFDNKANFSGRHHSSEFDVLIKISSKGLRDREFGEQKPVGKKRIAIIGDSYIAGNQVKVENTVPKKLENIIDTRRAEVINFGVSGFGLDQKTLYLTSKVLRYDPDIIFLFVSSNDLDDIKRNALVSFDGKNLKFHEKDPDNSGLKKVRKLANKSNLLTYLYYNIKQKKLEKQNLRMEHKLYLGLFDQEVQAYATISEALIKEANRKAQENGSRFIVVLGVDKLQIHADDKKDFKNIYEKDIDKADFFNNYFAKFASENEIMVVNLYSTFAESKGELFFRKDGHWNELGNELVAVELAKYLFHNKLI